MLALLGIAAASCLDCKRSKAGSAPPAASEAVSPAPPGPPNSDPGVDEIRDGDLFSVTIPSTRRACFAYPAARFDATKCPPGTKTIDESRFPTKARPLAIAFFPLGVDGGGAMAQLTVSMNHMPDGGPVFQPVPFMARAWARGLMKGVPTSFPGGTARGDESRVRLLTAHGVPVARFTYDVDGLSGAWKRYEHHVTYGIWSPEGIYTYALASVAQDADAADAVADEMVASLRIAHLAPPRPRHAP